tara:strand:+ start:5277 stop:5912 length:636 start_codon:yes stop_codon:yes gene_type:complete
MNFINEEIEKYSTIHSESEPELLKKLYRETQLNILNPRMISGPLQGRVLSLISQIINPNKILEIGTFTGYSTLCLAEGLKKNGTIQTIEKNDELIGIQNKYFEKSLYRKNIFQLTGNALQIIPTLNEKYDLIFLDADKKNYLTYLDLIIPKLKTKGILITDNVLWNGKVLNKVKDKDSEIIDNYNKKIKSDRRLNSVIFPIRDGITVSLKV